MESRYPQTPHRPLGRQPYATTRLRRTFGASGDSGHLHLQPVRGFLFGTQNGDTVGENTERNHDERKDRSSLIMKDNLIILQHSKRKHKSFKP